MKANRVCFTALALLSGKEVQANDNALANFLSAGNWYNLEQADLPNSLDDALVHETNGGDFIYNEGVEDDYYITQSNGNHDIIVEDGKGET